MTLRISIIGFGAVGQGVADVLMRTNHSVKVVAIADSRGAVVDKSGVDLAAALKRKKDTGTVATTDMTAVEVIESVDHEIMVETTPTEMETGGIGLIHIRKAFEMGRHVVTSNKGPLVAKYSELRGLARKNNLHFGGSGWKPDSCNRGRVERDLQLHTIAYG